MRTTDGVYSTIKNQTLAAGQPDKSGVRTQAVPDPIAIQGAPVLQKSFVYGLNYIDEVVAQIMPPPSDGSPAARRWVLQDANYNVVGLARECDNSLIRQFRYQPYGDFERDGANNVPGMDTAYSAGILARLACQGRRAFAVCCDPRQTQRSCGTGVGVVPITPAGEPARPEDSFPGRA